MLSESPNDPRHGIDERQQALEHLMNGKTARAILTLQGLAERTGEDHLAKAELACALAVGGRAADAERILATLHAISLPPQVLGRMETARALLAAAGNNLEAAGRLLASALMADPSYPLAHLAMGRYLLWAQQDLSRAKTHFEELRKLMPRSTAPLVHLIIAELESGDRQAAAMLSSEMVHKCAMSPTALVIRLLTLILNTPINGGLLLAAMAVTVFLPYAGPVILTAWSVVAFVSFILLRRTYARLALFPIVALAGMAVTFLIRVLILGRAFP